MLAYTTTSDVAPKVQAGVNKEINLLFFQEQPGYPSWIMKYSEGNLNISDIVLGT